jgi:hypothetical protein
MINKMTDFINLDNFFKSTPLARLSVFLPPEDYLVSFDNYNSEKENITKSEKRIGSPFVEGVDYY